MNLATLIIFGCGFWIGKVTNEKKDTIKTKWSSMKSKFKTWVRKTF